jgi:hypothetical protein
LVGLIFKSRDVKQFELLWKQGCFTQAKQCKSTFCYSWIAFETKSNKAESALTTIHKLSQLSSSQIRQLSKEIDAGLEFKHFA